MTPNKSKLMACLIALAMTQPAVAAEDFCKLLREFADSVKPSEKRVLKFHTILGSNFKDRDQPVTGAKRCDYAGYEQAKPVCVYLMKFGGIGYDAQNAMSVLQCFSKKTHFDVYARLQAISVSVPLGPAADGSRVDIDLQDDKELGGRVLMIAVVGH